MDVHRLDIKTISTVIDELKRGKDWPVETVKVNLIGRKQYGFKSKHCKIRKVELNSI